MKQHLDDDDLILHYYGETGTAAEPHLSDCADCRVRYQALQRVLNSVPDEVIPHREGEYAADVWERLAPRLGQRRRWFAWLARRQWAAVALTATLLATAFLAGRYAPRAEQETAQEGPEVRERVLLVAVGDHLNRSKMLLIEVANADPEQALDLAEGRELAEDLVYANRLYRQSAVRTGDTRVVSLLDDLERVLLEIANSPTELRPGLLQPLRERIEREGLIFKIRVAGSRWAAEEVL